jgi:S-DNA-T family DNA segregation ATPase FtsK/SpoIIIE
MKALMAQRAVEFGGLLLGLFGLLMLVALATYDPHDPSLVADFLLQRFGVVAVLPGLAMLSWSWRIASLRGLGSFTLRLAALIAALPMLAAVFSPIPLPRAAAWPVQSGLGGSIGQVLAAVGLGAGHFLFGILGSAAVWLLAGVLAVGLGLMSLGLSRSEWRSAGYAAGVVARYSVYGRRSAVGGMSNASGWLVHLVNRGLGLAPDELVAPPARVTMPIESARLVAEFVPPPVRDIRTVAPQRKPQQQSLPLVEAEWKFPPMSLLKDPPARAVSGQSKEAQHANALLLESVLSDYGVQGEIMEIRPGPVFTLYELFPAPGIRSARVIGLADDVARSLSVTAVHIFTVPGRNVISIEVPNNKRETVFLSEILNGDDGLRGNSRLSLVLGKDISGKAVFADLARMPHLMIAGTTGSGKSVGVNAMILSLLYRLSPDQCRLILIDPKMLELSTYEGIPHLMAPVVTEPAKAVTALKWTVREMERRYRAMSQLGVRNIGGFNDRVSDARAKGEVLMRKVQTGFDPDTGRPTHEELPLALETLPFIVVVVDEMADLMMVAGKEIEQAVQRLAQMAQAAGIHVIMATQRPSMDVITGTIKANFPTRISFRVISKSDSRTILDEQGAEQLLGMGDMLFMQGGGRITRVHGPFVSDDEVEKVVAFLREQGEPAYLDEVTEVADGSGDNDIGLGGISASSDSDKSLFDQAVDVVAREGKASTSFIQRHLNIGYNKAAQLIEQMEKDGIVGAANHVGKREILVRRITDDMDD